MGSVAWSSPICWVWPMMPQSGQAAGRRPRPKVWATFSQPQDKTLVNAHQAHAQSAESRYTIWMRSWLFRVYLSSTIAGLLASLGLEEELADELVRVLHLSLHCPAFDLDTRLASHPSLPTLLSATMVSPSPSATTDLTQLIPQLLPGLCQELGVETKNFKLVLFANEHDVDIKPIKQLCEHMDVACTSQPRAVH